MPSLLLYAATALITYIAYVQLVALFQTIVRKAPPVASNSWWTFLRGKSVPGNVLIEQFYEKYSKNNEAFIAGGHYVLPPSVFAAIRKIPDRMANSTPANEDGLVLDPFLGHDNTDIIHLVRTDLTRSVDAMIAPLKSEIHTSLSANFLPPSTAPTVLDNEEWYPLTVHPSTLSAIGRITTRILVGAKYTTLPAWTDTLAGFANGIIIQSFLLRNLPRCIIPLIAPLFNTTRRVAKLRALILPDVRALLANPPPPGTYPSSPAPATPQPPNPQSSPAPQRRLDNASPLRPPPSRLLHQRIAAPPPGRAAAEPAQNPRSGGRDAAACGGVRGRETGVFAVWGRDADAAIWDTYGCGGVPSSQPSDRFMSFGHGKHACPGRHLALVVVKLFLLEFLERFEFKEVERPKDWQLGFMFNAVPDMKTNVWIRPRRDEVEVETGA
ncbi:hypothetical protein V502_05410 [Pseudogymnoascus sp. VKM F-4520 (FW-2644)]|nr:hypothetical protein V502_05410 [Pseudogymnoascus sp. VKM F-4520 (FW-2644)]